MKLALLLIVCGVVLQGTIIAANVEAQCSKSESGNQIQSNYEFWEGISGAEYIEDLDKENYDQFIEENPKVFVMYYHPGCYWSVDAREGFAGAAKKMNTKIKFASVDCTKPQAGYMCDNPNQWVPGYPTFFYFKNGQWNEKYEGGKRTTEAFVKYLTPKAKAA